MMPRRWRLAGITWQKVWFSSPEVRRTVRFGVAAEPERAHRDEGDAKKRHPPATYREVCFVDLSTVSFVTRSTVQTRNHQDG